MVRNRGKMVVVCAVLILLSARDFHLLSGSAWAGESGAAAVLYDDQVDPACLQYSQAVAGEGMDGGQALQLLPDPWHRPTYKLYCGSGARRDFRPYDVLQFYIRSPHADPGAPSLYVRTWNQTGQTVAIRDHIASGIIDETWRLATIPIADLATAQWDLGDVEALVLNKDNQKRTYYVDRIALRQVTPPALITSGDGAPFWESNRVLRLVFTKICSALTARDLQNYSLQSSIDLAYAAPLSPVDSSVNFGVERFSPTGGPEIRYEVYLEFPQALRNGCAYRLTVQGLADDAGNSMGPAVFDFTYDDRTPFNPNLKVNQVGYLPNAPKVGYFGGFLGDLGGGVWAVGERGALYRWSERKGWESAAPVTEKTLRAVAATREDDVWAVGDAGIMLHWDGKNWIQFAAVTSKDLHALSFGPTHSGWAVGAGGTALRYRQGVWTLVPTPVSHALRGVWTGPGDTARAVGDEGTIIFWNGAEWVMDERPTGAALLAVHGPHEGWLWAVGESGTVLVRRYGHWSVFTDVPGTETTLRTVITDPAGQVWVGGDNGLLWHKPGFGSSAFAAEPSGTCCSIHAIGRQHGRHLVGVGEEGTVIIWKGAGWQVEAPLSENYLAAVFGLPYGALRLSQPPPWVTIENTTTGEVVLSVPLKLEAGNWHLSGEDVYSFDFSSLSVPGTYQAYLPGIGRSVPFVIGHSVLHQAAVTAARGLYYQRCGTALVAPYAEPLFTRPLDHEFTAGGRKVDGVFHESLANSPLYAGETPGVAVDAHGGWHDAGDYGKYLPPAASALWSLFTAYDLGPEKFVDGAWNIPESGNGVPDLLDETRWETDWIVRMQAADGGIHHKLTSQTWFSGMPHQEPGVRYIFAKTTHDTASGAAVLASAARLWAPFDSVLAEQYRQRAERAWAFLQRYPQATPAGGFKNPPGNTTGEYNDSDDRDNRLWAAAELYRTTGKPEYRQYFESWWATHAHDWGWNSWQHFHRCAYWAYLRSPWLDGSAEIKEEIRDHIFKEADEIVALTYANPYRNGARLDVPEWVGWGTFTQSSEYALPLLQARFFNASPEYLTAALLNVDAQLGANPLSLSFITSLGTRSPKDPLHMVSLHDGVEIPVPGLPVFGVAAHLSNDNPFNAASQADANNHPPRLNVMDPYPILRRYIDAHELVAMTEFTVIDMALAAGVLSLLADDPCDR